MMVYRLGRQQAIEVLADDFTFVIAKDLFRGLVEQDDRLLVVDDDYRRGNQVQQVVIAVFAVAQSLQVVLEFAALLLVRNQRFAEIPQRAMLVAQVQVIRLGYLDVQFTLGQVQQAAPDLVQALRHSARQEYREENHQCQQADGKRVDPAVLGKRSVDQRVGRVHLFDEMIGNDQQSLVQPDQLELGAGQLLHGTVVVEGGQLDRGNHRVAIAREVSVDVTEDRDQRNRCVIEGSGYPGEIVLELVQAVEQLATLEVNLLLVAVHAGAVKHDIQPRLEFEQAQVQPVDLGQLGQVAVTEVFEQRGVRADDAGRGKVEQQCQRDPDQRGDQETRAKRKVSEHTDRVASYCRRMVPSASSRGGSFPAIRCRPRVS